MKFITLQEILDRLNLETLMHAGRVALIAAAGYLFIRVIAVVVRRTLTRNASEQSKILIHKMIMYTGAALIVIYILDELGVKLSTLLGAAGVLGVALGIASQKSLGNIISGFFLVSDKTFEVGDAIKVGTIVGVVHSLDLLSIKLRTFDNTLIRIPNDLIITTEITNITRFPIRRMDLSITVTYGSDLSRTREVLLDIADNNPLCLQEPSPFFLIKNFTASGVEILFAVWFEKSGFVDVKNSVFLSIRESFLREGIELSVMEVKVSYAPGTSAPPASQSLEEHRS
jgi:small-conductance mechanosensitive channel